MNWRFEVGVGVGVGIGIGIGIKGGTGSVTND